MSLKEEDVPDSGSFDFLSSGINYLRYKTCILNFSRLDCQEVLDLLLALQGSQKDIPDSFEELLTLSLFWQGLCLFHAEKNVIY